MGILNPNIATLEATVGLLGPVLDEVVFVGGTIVGLLIDDPGACAARPTRDVDMIAQMAGNQGYQWATRVMLGMGFQPDTRAGAPVCRWVQDGFLVDLMGTGDTPFGTTNPWYMEGFCTRIPVFIGTAGQRIFTLPAPVFLLTKWVVYLDRGKGSMVARHDIEDILNVMDGRLELAQEAQNASPKVHVGLADMARVMLASQQFREHCLESLGDRQAWVRGTLEGFLGLAR